VAWSGGLAAGRRAGWVVGFGLGCGGNRPAPGQTRPVC